MAGKWFRTAKVSFAFERRSVHRVRPEGSRIPFSITASVVTHTALSVQTVF